jgi:hypothetical protein
MSQLGLGDDWRATGYRHCVARMTAKSLIPKFAVSLPHHPPNAQRNFSLC